MPPPPTKPAQRPGERLLAGRVDPGGRLVEDQQLRLAGQRPGDQRALLLAAGEGGDRVAGPVGEADRGQRVARPRPGRRAPGGRRKPAPGQPAGGDHLADGGRHAAAGAEPLRHVADARPLPEPAQRRAEQLDLAGGQRDQAEHGADQRGLAGAVGAEDRRPPRRRRRVSETSRSTGRPP